jgi:hypothetical protein
MDKYSSLNLHYGGIFSNGVSYQLDFLSNIRQTDVLGYSFYTLKQHISFEFKIIWGWFCS